MSSRNVTGSPVFPKREFDFTTLRMKNWEKKKFLSHSFLVSGTLNRNGHLPVRKLVGRWSGNSKPRNYWGLWWIVPVPDMLDFLYIRRGGLEGKYRGLLRSSSTVHHRGTRCSCWLKKSLLSEIMKHGSKKMLIFWEVSGAREVRKRNETKRETTDTLNPFLHSWYADFSESVQFITNLNIC